MFKNIKNKLFCRNKATSISRLSHKSQGNEHPSLLTGLIFILVGLIIIYLSTIIYPVFIDASWAEQLIISIGTSLFCIGMISILIDIPAWRKYFESRLKSLVIKREYLKTLSRENLLDLQTNALRVQYGNDDIGEKGSFWYFFSYFLHPMIGEPYRENARQDLTLTDNEQQSGSLKVKDIVTYTCRKNGGKIHDIATFGYTKEEAEGMEITSFKIRYPENHEKAGEEENLTKEKKEHVIPGQHEGSMFDLSKYSDIDELIIEKESIHVMKINNFQLWTMSHPTKNIIFSLNFPCEYEVQIESFLLNPKLVRIYRAEGYLLLEYNSWVLPRSGIAWLIKKKAESPFSAKCKHEK